jgi:hypothetical protein
MCRDFDAVLLGGTKSVSIPKDETFEKCFPLKAGFKFKEGDPPQAD